MPLAQLMQALPDAAILTDPGGVVREWNEAATRLFGWTAEDMVGRPLVERFPPAARAQASEHLRQYAAAGGWDGEFEDYRKDGSRVWTELHIHPVRDTPGTVTGVLGVSRQLPTGRTAAVERERHERYAADILNSMSAHIAVLGPDGRIREVNRAWTRFAAENAPGGSTSPPTDLGVDYVGLCRGCTGEKSDEAGAAADGIEDVLRGRRSYFVMEYPCDSPTEARWFAMTVTPLSTRDGGAVVAHYDITARKAAELAVASQSRRMELALAAGHMGVWTLDLARGRIDWSAEVHNIVGVDEFDGRLESWIRLVHPDDLGGMQAQFNEALERRMPFTGEFRIVQPAGDIRWLANVAHIECDRSGRAVSVVGTVQDITARKRSEWALTAYNQILELIAAGADLHKILDEVVRLVEEQLSGSLCSILILDKEARCLRVGAGRSLPPEYNRAVDGVPVAAKSGSCGTAAFRRQTVTVTDIATDPLWDDYRESALRHGLRSCVSVPILSSGNVPGFEKGEAIGTFALYNRTPGDFDRLTYAILSGAEELVRRAVQAGQGAGTEPESARVIEAAHLAGVAIERDQVGHAVRESEERFRAVIDSAPAAIYVKTLDGRHQFVNRTTAEMFGAPAADWVGRRSRELLPPHLADLCEASDRAVRAAEGPVHERHTSRLPDGREVTVLATHLLLRHAGGEPYGICGILRDITALVAAQREFERLWLNAPEPLCVAGFDGYFKRVNPAWTRLLGWSEEELLARPCAEFIHPDDRVRTAEAGRAAAAGQPAHRFVNRYRCADGTYRWFSWDAISLPTEERVYGFVRDVTDERQLEEQFRQAQKMEAVGQLASGVAHDFNNLLTVIIGYTEIMLGGSAPADPKRDHLTQVLQAGQRATELTSQLLAFSRKAIIEPMVLNVNHVVESSARMLRRLIGEDVNLDTRLGDVPPVKIDPGQLEQVFMNLAVNARDAMPAGGRLSITTEVADRPDRLPTGIPPGAYVRVSVADTGSGIPPEVQARIFEPFFTTKGPGKGTGLGLATVYGIVRQAGGVIVVESPPGAGTTFRILLPVVPGSPTRAQSAAISVAPRGTETVLIAEDEDGVRNLASAVLENQGYKVLLARTGAEAVKVADEHPGPIDLLLTDVVMPDLGGRALAEVVRGRRPGVRVMYMSGYTDDAVIRSGVEAARDWFIQKPYTPLSLARRVREALDGSADPRPS
ncbi:multi-sensor hybrid histidine kinase : Multi-sensor hybrid histidine kinase OS=Chthoniobacter flavus Ellin428 GN=CfE428DRAFT_3487 PE=4 SV=1: PAS: PAS_4: PAS_3: GAF: PAS_4: PAS_3: HisKA: HATPase_c: Response_reg [Gemmataceae bacterium]|nr:multi-sensor hybrid histidine kinase : Multi-sensor hybrid histidine kinase OS=Chthoniobacter flavus Ellin428 GN=CfE428DRAFT_3487 PE=4 SV=1: PAS: PAS_4: PAS_3: GAF: PAS_4: PAS_3: HisKA: HATPase_c: Response_reg [Gemmataceae bacterium]VTT99254.1 multi-sensor hybrid histidine kinase : Multi-sensor hybrid histidine kinase OS=Chthoniobacter flavus Ellin428 GN=CfE428DRAFT_3487 PE=4 SV=1: PAS: PAS_4: PAS_3: GAF: PAS_4: PAS_3: HisKA: HATPase_c: Response_reg [Gemmataceae bacterium]